MILVDTPYSEIHRIMAREDEKVQYAIEKYSKDAAKYFNACNRFKASMRSLAFSENVYYTFYIVPKTKNKYLIWYGLRQNIVTGKPTFKAGSLLVVEGDNKRMFILAKNATEVTEGNQRKIDSLHIYTGHFFSRYRLRNKMMDNMSTFELVSTYMVRNAGVMANVHQQEFGMAATEKNGDKNVCWQTAEGYSFGTEEEINTTKNTPLMVVVHKTFISPNEMRKEQMASSVPKEDLEIVNLFFKNGFDIERVLDNFMNKTIE